jgi:hypothetical protein
MCMRQYTQVCVTRLHTNIEIFMHTWHSRTWLTRACVTCLHTYIYPWIWHTHLILAKLDTNTSKRQDTGVYVYVCMCIHTCAHRHTMYTCQFYEQPSSTSLQTCACRLHVCICITRNTNACTYFKLSTYIAHIYRDSHHRRSRLLRLPYIYIYICRQKSTRIHTNSTYRLRTWDLL